MRPFFRQLRILILLLVLLFVAADAWWVDWRTARWNQTQWVAVYPVNGDGTALTQKYIESLTAEDFQSIGEFFMKEAKFFELSLPEPTKIVFGHIVDERPPAIPEQRKGLAVALWSLKLRYWAFRANQLDDTAPDIKMFVVYHDPATHAGLAHSTGLKKGKVGVVNAFASRALAQSNNVVIAHEVLHTLGATDKYGGGGLPRFPEGYAEPDREPLYPQRFAELMGGRIPHSRVEASIPRSLRQVLIGEQTAREISWLR